MTEAWGPGSHPEHSKQKMSAKLCCIAQACSLSTWVAQVGGSGASHRKSLSNTSPGISLLLLPCFLNPARLFPATALKHLSHPVTSLLQTLLPTPLQQGSPTVKLVFLLHQYELILSQKPWHLLTFLSPNIQPQAEVLPCTSQTSSLPFHTALATPTHPSGAAGST